MNTIEKYNSMSEMFKGYFPYTNSEYKRIWQKALIVVDTNILLNLYRYSNDTRNSFFVILDKLNSRIWIPHQVGKEFAKNRESTINNARKEYENIYENIKNAFNGAKGIINKKKDNQLKCKKQINEIIDHSLNDVKKILDRERDDDEISYKNDIILEHILRLFDGCVGKAFSEEEYNNVKNEGKRRVNEQIPPGYKDKNKEENGDYYIFYSMMQKAKKDKRDMIFITDDVKKDWFYICDGEKRGGRSELLNEFYKETGQLLLIYTADGFANAYKNNNPSHIEFNKNMIDELKNTRSEYNNAKVDKYDISEFLIPGENIRGKYNDFDAKVYKDTIKLIQESHLPRNRRSEMYDKLTKIMNYGHEDKYSMVLELLNYLKSVEEQYKNDYASLLLREYEDQYHVLIRRLKYSEPNAQKRMVKLLKQEIKEHLKVLRMVPGNGRKLATIKLEEILSKIEDERNSIEEIVEALEKVLNTGYYELF